MNSKKKRKYNSTKISTESSSSLILSESIKDQKNNKLENTNPILIALGATPRGSGLDKKSWSQWSNNSSSKQENAKKNNSISGTLSSSSSQKKLKSDKESKLMDHSSPESIRKRKSHSLEKNTNNDDNGRTELGEERLSIDPSHVSIEHSRATKIVRREIAIGSPTWNEDDECDPYISPIMSRSPDNVANKNLRFDYQPQDLILYVFSFLVESDDLFNMSQVSTRWRELTNMVSLCRSLRNTKSDGTINWINFQNMGIKNKGTEGTCYKSRQRSTGKILAMKQARVFPKGEGVPYYMLRELAVLQGMKHPNIAELDSVNLAQDSLHVFFPYVDKTLHEIINPNSDPNGGKVLSENVSRRLMHQLLDAIAFCHRRGVLHRNLKPKHLLIDLNDKKDLSSATLKLSDFALVRATGLPRRTYTMEVVTLWYRPPEILMGVRGYSPAVDIWSVGCIFAEMALGKPLFTGISEIDQLFQIFSKLSTPTKETWFSFKNLPNYQFEFPNWKKRPLDKLFPQLSNMGLDLLSKLLTYDPDKRISAEMALRHPYFLENNIFSALKSHCNISDHLNQMKSLRIASRHEHIHLFHQFLRLSELDLCKDIDYLNRQRALRPMHRAMLVDWLIEVVDVFDMCLRTAFLAVNYTDRYLNSMLVKKAKFQLLGATCLHVASKCEDVSYIGVDDLAMCADNVYTSIEVLKMEEKLLNTLDFHLAVPTSLDFLNIFEALMPPLPQKVVMLAQYLAELSLQEYQFLKYAPSLVATCCISLAYYCISDISWNKPLENATQYKWKDLKECMYEIQSMYSSSPFSVLNVVKKRYSKQERCQVSALHPPNRYNMVF